MADTKMKRVDVASVVRHDGPICLPQSMDYAAAVKVLQQKIASDDLEITLSEEVNCFPWDGALALSKALAEQFGFAMQEKEWGFFGPKPPAQISIKISPTETVNVPWGRFSLPGIDGTVACGVAQNADEQIIFNMNATIKQKYAEPIKKLFARVQQIVSAESIYRSRAITVKFRDEDGDLRQIPGIEFMQLSGPPAIFNRSLEHELEVSIFTPLRYPNASRAAGVPLKRGVLLAGEYGTGKTMTAAYVAREACRCGWTFIYVPDVSELPEALKLARLFEPCVVFAEDVDRAAGTVRTNDVNELMNTLDGISNKQTEIMVVLTSNHPNDINEAMRRPGRIDKVVEVTLPDAEAVGRMLQFYGESVLVPGEDLSVACGLLAGNRPAVVRECIERSKLEAIHRSAGQSSMICGQDLAMAAEALLKELQLFVPKVLSSNNNHLEGFAGELANRIKKQLHSSSL